MVQTCWRVAGASGFSPSEMSAAMTQSRASSFSLFAGSGPGTTWPPGLFRPEAANIAG